MALLGLAARLMGLPLRSEPTMPARTTLPSSMTLTIGVTQSLKMLSSGDPTGTSTSNAGQGYFLVQPQTSLALSLYYLVQGMTQGTFQVRLFWYKNDKTAYGSTTALLTVSADTGGWKAYSNQVTVPQQTAFATVTFANAQRDGTVWVDDVVLTQV